MKKFANSYILLILLLCPFVSGTAQVEYPYENFNNDATRLNSYFNLWGGNWGVMNADPDNPYVAGGWQYENGYSTDTRDGTGRCLRMDYTYTSENVSWGGGIWSSVKLHVDSLDHYLNFNDLFYPLESPLLGVAQIDSIAFWAKLDNVQGTQSYIIDFEIRDHRDQFGHQAKRSFSLATDGTWRRYSASLADFENWQAVDPTRVKKISVILQAELNNESPSGTVLLDDIVFIDKDRTIPGLAEDETFLEYINLLNFRYFLEFTDSHCLALDRSAFADLVSIAAVGFQLTGLCIADKNEWLPEGEAKNTVKKILRNLWNAPHGTAQDCIDNKFGYATCEGLWYHFLKSGELTRIQPVDPNSVPTELSLFDTGLLMAGVLSCREYFQGDAEIVNLADSLYLNVDWPFMLEEGPSADHYGRLYIGWSPETGYTPWAMDYYTEEDILVNLLSLCSPTHPVPMSTFHRVERHEGSYDAFNLVQSAPGALFTYFFAQLWARFPDSLDAHEGIPLNYHSNTENAILANRAFCKDQYEQYPWWNENIFGLTACDGPDSSFCLGPGLTNYHAYGALPGLGEVDHNGTIAVYGAGSSIIHRPDESISTLRYYADEIPGLFNHLFGYYDAFHLDPDNYNFDPCIDLGYNGPWISNYQFGIDAGPMMIMIDNYLSGLQGAFSVRDYFTDNQYVTCSLEKMFGVESGAVSTNSNNLALFQNFPNPCKRNTSIEFSVPSAGEVSLSVFNQLGRPILNIKEENVTAGKNSYPVDCSGLKNGVYFYRLAFRNTYGSFNSSSKKMIVMN